MVSLTPWLSMPPWAGSLPWTEAVVLVMAFVWGATLGSFVNVVAYRVPRGESVVTGSSRCPACGVAIRPRDNIPVVGWLLLGGRCRSCRSPISSRYILVEAVCGLIAAAVAAAELVDGRSLPWLAPASGQTLDRMLMHHDLRPLAAWALHACMLIMLVARSLLGEGHAGGRAARIAVLLILLATVALPSIGPPGMDPAGGPWPESPRLRAATACLAGSAAGWLLARMTAAANAGSLAVLGAAVGWQTVTVVAVVTAIVRSLGSRATRRPGAWFDPLPAVATAAIVCWRPIRTACMLAWP